MSDHKDDEIIAQYQAGNPKAFEMIVRSYQKQVFNFAYRILSNRADAEDVTSETFIQLSQGGYKPRPEAKFSTWLLTVARNRCLDRIRRRQKTVSLWFKKDGQNDYDTWDVIDEKNTPSQQMKKEEMAEVVRKAIDQLPIEQKEAIVLREYFQKDYQEIADILDCSLEKVKLLIFRARERLRVEIGPYVKEGL